MHGAKVIVDEAQDNAPVGDKPHYLGSKHYRKTIKILGLKTKIKKEKAEADKVQPGFMRKQIRRRTRKTPDGEATVSIGVFRRRGEKGVAFYWIFKEFGTVREPAKPFLVPAFESKKEEAVDKIRDYLAPRIQKEAEKLRKR